MKIRNIFAALAFGLIAMVTLGTAGCAKDTKGDDTFVHDTLSKTDTISKFNLNKTTVGASGGRMELEFTPDGDWTFTSNTEWLTVAAAAGTKTDRVLVFEVAENTDFDARMANTVLTVAGVKYPFTIHQQGTPRQVLIFDMITDFSDDLRTITISNIVANIEIEIKSFPDWMASAVLERDEETGHYTIIAEIKSGNYDSEIRKGDIAVGDVNSDFVAYIPVVAEPSSLPFRMGDASMFDEPFPAVSAMAGDMSRVFKVLGASDAVDPYVFVMTKTVFRNNAYTVTDVITDCATFEKVNSVVPAAPYQQVEWKMTMEPNYDVVADSIRYVSVFLVKQSEVPVFKASKNASKMLYRVSQGSAEGIAINPTAVTMDWSKAGSYTVTLSALDLLGVPSGKISTVIGAGLAIGAYRGTLSNVPSVTTPSAVKGAGWSDYVFTLTNTSDDNNGYAFTQYLPTFTLNMNFPNAKVLAKADVNWSNYALFKYNKINTGTPEAPVYKDDNKTVFPFNGNIATAGTKSNEFIFYLRNGVKTDDLYIKQGPYHLAESTLEIVSVGSPSAELPGMTKYTTKIVLTKDVDITKMFQTHYYEIMVQGISVRILNSFYDFKRS